MKCPYVPPPNKLRGDLPPMIPRIAKLPVDKRGYPIPFFVQWINGEPDFRIMDRRRYNACVEKALCWVCGQTLTQPLCFPIGPMCAVNRVSSEPPSHAECAEWSAQACPFMTKPKMVRREDEITREGYKGAPGVMLTRNPGVMALWYTRTYKFFPDGAGQQLIALGDPERVDWWKEARLATRAEVEKALEEGMPFLMEQCDKEEPEVQELARRELLFERRKLDALLPAA